MRASHILLKTEGKDEAAVKAQAEQVLKQVKAGADFAELAKKYSEDEASAKQRRRPRLLRQGPDGAGVRGGRVLAGARRRSSDLVKTQYGFHIIKVIDKKAASTRTLDEVRPQIEDQLSWERAKAQAADMAAALEKEITKPADLDKVGRGARPQGAGVGLLHARRADSRASARRRRRRPRRSS